MHWAKVNPIYLKANHPSALHFVVTKHETFKSSVLSFRPVWNKKVWPLFAFQIEKAKMLSSAQEQLLPRAVLNATYFPKDILKVSRGQTSISRNILCISLNRYMHDSLNSLFLGCATSVATCWWSLTDGCSLFFYMAVRSHTSHLFHIVAGSQHGSKDLLMRVSTRVWYKSGGFWTIRIIRISKLIRWFHVCITPPEAQPIKWWPAFFFMYYTMNVFEKGFPCVPLFIVLLLSYYCLIYRNNMSCPFPWLPTFHSSSEYSRLEQLNPFLTMNWFFSSVL